MRRLCTARPGRAARVLLLLATLVGLAAMHTLGHGTAAHAAMTPMPAHSTAAMAARTEPVATSARTGLAAVEAQAGAAAATAAQAAAMAQAGPVAMAATAEAVRGGCPDGHCARLLAPPARHTTGLDWWDVCVAVLTALGVLLLLFWLVGVVRRRAPAGLSRLRAAVASRGPPVSGLGLTLATVSVMRH
jgi:hypothetical protein